MTCHEAMQIADKVSDLILFHRRVRRNGDRMMLSVDDEREIAECIDRIAIKEKYRYLANMPDYWHI